MPRKKQAEPTEAPAAASAPVQATTSAAPKGAAEEPPSQPWQFKPYRGHKGVSDSDLFIINYVRTMTKKNPWYYRDRCGAARGPATMPIMREAWVNGIIDQNTLVWGQGLADFLPIKNVRTLTGQIRTPEGAPCHLQLPPDTMLPSHAGVQRPED